MNKKSIAALLMDAASVLNESILDPINSTRCREIFNDNEVMKPEVAKFIKDTFNLWFEQLNSEFKVFKINTFKAIGSSTGFQYTDTSDLDIQVYISMLPGHEFKEIFQLVKILPNGNNIPGTQHPVNYFFVDEKDPTNLNKVENLYDIYTQKWEKCTGADDLNIPILYVREISRLFTDAFDLLLGRYERDVQYLQDALKLNPDTQSISEAEKESAINRCVSQVRSNIDSMRLADRLIHGFRLQAYDDDNFFHISINYMDDNNPRKSMNEAIYKTLDRFQYREKLREKISHGKELLNKILPNEQ